MSSTAIFLSGAQCLLRLLIQSLTDDWRPSLAVRHAFDLAANTASAH
jgi:hypothetical protein